jgi:flagellar biosynthesis/type III secretory pathway protein FliH
LEELSSWLKDPGQSGLRRAFVSWIKRVLSRTRGEDIEAEELSEVKSMLEQRVQEWFREWREQGLAEGRREGREEGREEGRLRGEAGLLLRLLSCKFGELPEGLVQRVNRAGCDDLCLWSQRMLEATTLAEVFDD